MKTLILLFLLTSCGYDITKSEEKAEELEQSEPLPEILHFQGYVQTAFTIIVDGVSFNDTEHFYTNFKRDLIVKNRPDLAEVEITVLGTYGHSTFGANAPVFIAPMTEGGHLFEAITDGKRHFFIDVDKASAKVDESTRYQSKIMLRIGLEIGGTKHCLLLHSTKTDILFVAEQPIIFDNFTTQLNDYECVQNTVSDTYEGISGPAPTSSEPEARSIDSAYPEASPNVALIEKGVSTPEDVKALLGEPLSYSENNEGKLSYSYTNPNYCKTVDTCTIVFFGDVVLSTPWFRGELLKAP